MAETVSCLLRVPIDLIKERKQTANIDKVKDINIRTIVKNNGIKDLYQGYGSTLLSFGPYLGYILLYI